MNEKQISDAAETIECLLFVRADRLVGQIPARGDDREAQLAQEDVVERRVREHRAQVRIPRRDQRCNLF